MDNENDHIIVNGYRHVRYKAEPMTPEVSTSRSEDYYRLLDGRRSVRDYSNRPVPRHIIETLIKTA